MVFAHKAAMHSLKNFTKSTAEFTVPEWDSGSAVDTDEQVIIARRTGMRSGALCLTMSEL